MTDRKKLFVQQSIEIQAAASQVWQVLTVPALTRQWVSEFFGQDGEIASDWKLGDPVQWKMLADGNVYVEGNVTAIERDALLRFTVFDVRSERPPVSDEDGITFRLAEREGQTLLSVTQGDFGTMDDGEKYYHASVLIWEKVLPIIKAVAEMA